MTQADKWLLPDGVDELLPPEALQVEQLRRRVLDLFRSWGYELVMPPLIEYLESLLTGAGHDLDLETFKVTDQLTGRLMGVRPDITPQVARMDAHSLNREGVTRLCYASTVLRTLPQGLAGTRTPVQAGIELYGHSGVASDVEVIELMLETLQQAGISEPVLELGHVGIFGALAEAAGLDHVQQLELVDIYRRKSLPELAHWLPEQVADQSLAAALATLPQLSGDEAVLAEFRQQLADVPQALSCLENLEAIAGEIRHRFPALQLYFDLSELRGYQYHTGCVFAVYRPGIRSALAKGGRYDAVGQAYGRSRPATGFSVDIKQLALLTGHCERSQGEGILAPGGDAAGLREAIRRLRMAGEVVIQQLPGQTAEEAGLGCNRQLQERNGQWEVVSLE